MKKIFRVIFLMLTVVALTACNSSHSDLQDDTETDSIPKYSVQLELNCVKNFIFSKYDVDIFVDGDKLGKLDHGATRTYSVELIEGTHTLVATKEGSRTIDGTIDFVVSEDSKLMYKLSCTGQQVDIEEIIEPEVTAAETGIEETSGEKDGVSIDNINNQANSETDTKHSQTEESDNKYSLDSDGLFKIPDKETGDVSPIDNSNSQTDDSLYYSTNDRATSKKGNTGVFAYSNTGGSYSLYFVIDFDEGYVYRFIEGNGDNTCDRLKIDSGDLNSVLIITYHDGDDEWSYGLHFKRKNLPDALILQEQDGFEYTYYPTDLDSALKIRDSKTITDY